MTLEWDCRCSRVRKRKKKDLRGMKGKSALRGMNGGYRTPQWIIAVWTRKIGVGRDASRFAAVGEQRDLLMRKGELQIQDESGWQGWTVLGRKKPRGREEKLARCPIEVGWEAFQEQEGRIHLGENDNLIAKADLKLGDGGREMGG